MDSSIHAQCFTGCCVPPWTMSEPPANSNLLLPPTPIPIGLPVTHSDPHPTTLARQSTMLRAGGRRLEPSHPPNGPRPGMEPIQLYGLPPRRHMSRWGAEMNKKYLTRRPNTPQTVNTHNGRSYSVIPPSLIVSLICS